MIDPRMLCRKHLLGEHIEHHVSVANIPRGKSVKGYLCDGLLDPKTLQDRHDALVAEMERRGYYRDSPLMEIDISSLGYGKIEVLRNIEDLRITCENCAERIKEHESLNSEDQFWKTWGDI